MLRLMLSTLLVLIVLPTLSAAPTTILPATPTDLFTTTETREFVTACPTAGRRAVRRDPSGDPPRAQVVTDDCAVVSDSIGVSNASILVLSDLSLDSVLSYPDAATLNFAFNRLVEFPTDATMTVARSLILRGNKFRSLADVHVPPQLEYLDVRACEITTLGTKTTYPPSLVKLRLSDNKLSTLKGMTFPSRLRALEMNNQPLVSLEGASLPPTLEILVAANTSLSTLNASTQLPDSLTTLDLSANALTAFPDLSTLSSLTDLNLSSNAIPAIAGVRFPPTLTRLDLRGNPLEALEITQSDLLFFQTTPSSALLLPPLLQSECRSADARTVRVTSSINLCVMEDAAFLRRYGVPPLHLTADGIRQSGLPRPPDATQTVQPATQASLRTSPPLTWAILILAICAIAVVVIAVISTLSWKHQQLRRKVHKLLARHGHLRTSSCADDLLRAVGLEGELTATQLNPDDIKVLHVLGKHGPYLVYLAAMRDGDGDLGVDDAVSTSRMRMQADELNLDRRSAALSIPDLDRACGRQLVTLTRLVPEHATDARATLRTFVLEIQLRAQLEHPKLVALVGVCWNTLADVTMVLEYLPNGDLRTLLQLEKDRVATGGHQFTRLGWTEAPPHATTSVLPSKSAIALDVAEALVYLHSCAPPVLHRALRSTHVLLSDRYVAKLSNLHAPSDSLLLRDVATTAALESVAWVAPEILRGEPFTDKADVYAFGILLTELATGLPPFAGLATAAIVLKVAHDHARPSLRGVDCPELIQALAQRCMHADANARPSAVDAHRELFAVRMMLGCH